ncbi:streptophobe family protein [Streptomyces sp. NPDC058067]|uniref:streptophobe family protein n=1 Tax=Streptomyces sp. NPDC058067 TaxID=3346324 RepID=UPI0036F18D2A
MALTGAPALGWFFLRSLRSLRGTGVEVTSAELGARVGSVVALFLAMPGGLARAGHDLITIDGGSSGSTACRAASRTSCRARTCRAGSISGGLLPDRVGDLVHATVTVGFTVETGTSLLGGALWVTGRPGDRAARVTADAAPPRSRRRAPGGAAGRPSRRWSRCYWWPSPRGSRRRRTR